MTEKAEFEEKTYEKYFGQEVSRYARVAYSPGQVSEQHLGFDEAFFVPWFLFRTQFAHLHRRLWGRPAGMKLGALDHLADEIGAKLPPFKFNFFVQYKRPEFLRSHRAREWGNWRQPYFRYEITPHQQVALSHLAATAGDRAAVVYASPAFWQSDQLFGCARAGRVIQESNVVPASMMNGHDHFTYVAPGGNGIAHSDPERVSAPTVEQLVRSGLDRDGVLFRDHLIKTANMIEVSLESNSEGQRVLNMARNAVFNLVTADGNTLPRTSVVYALATIEAFSDAFNVSVCAMG